MKKEADPRTQSAFSPTELAERTLHRRAIEAVIWGMPAVNAELMFQSDVATPKPTSTRSSIGRGPSLQRIRRSRPIPIRFTSIPLYNTKDGPIVLEVPAASENGSITGSVDDAGKPPSRM